MSLIASSRWRVAVRRISSIAFTLFFTILLVEMGVRALHLIPDTLPTRYRSMPGEEDFAPIPNQTGRSFYGVVHTVNSLGLRDRERPLAKKADVTRIAVLGDSVVWGFGVPSDETFVTVLERELGPTAEVWNLGVQATNTFNQKARYARLAPLIHPDLTVVVVVFNDLQPHAEHFRITKVGTLSIEERNAPFPDFMRPHLARSATFRSLMRGYRLLWEKRTKEEFKPDYIPLMEAQLDQILVIARQNGSKLMIAACPGIWPRPEEYDILASALQRFAAQRSIDFINLESALGRPPDPELFLKFDPVHPNEEGNRKIARALYTAVKRARG